ncbi:MAG: YfhO family protein [Bryobacteraceae bacterium]|nr:YfhO family protein [Bryobacteraceae bacterium]
MRFLVAAGSIVSALLLFHEYLPPAKSVHFWADIDGYHYPLLNYAHKAIRQGRFPQWDHTVYSGMPFAGNIQAGLFYPPNWLLFVLNRRHDGMRMKTVEWLEIAHYWLAFYLAYLWLRRRCGGRNLPAVLGGAVFALGGYPLAESQHLGVICGYAWLPLAMLSLDEFAESLDWRRLWKLAAASALCLLAGYPAHWLAFAVAAAAYGLGVAGWRGVLAAVAAVAFSGLLAGPQLGASLETMGLKETEWTYFPSVEKDPKFYLLLAMPNFYEHSRTLEAPSQPHEQYGYLGSPALFALLWLMGRRLWRPALPGLTLLAATAIALTDPGGLVTAVAHNTPVIREISRAWNFLGLLPLAAAFFTALSLKDFLARETASVRRWAALAIPCLLIVWMARQLLFRQYEFWLGSDWLSGVEAAICVVLFGLGCAAARRSRMAVAALLMMVLSEYYVYGVGRRFNAKPGDPDEDYHKDARTGGKEMIGLDNAVYDEMKRHPAFRTAIVYTPHPTDMRHYGLSTPQGFDPFLTTQYKREIERFTAFETNRIFPPPVQNEEFLRQFGVRFILVLNPSETMRKLAADKRFRLMPPAEAFLAAFEYLHAEPAYRFAGGKVDCLRWSPEHRAFQVHSAAAGEFILAEQFFPGWRAWVDGNETPIARVNRTLQAIRVPAGAHAVEFRYQSMGLRWGAAVSGAALIILIAVARSSRASRGRRRWPAPSPEAEGAESTPDSLER